MDIGVQFHVLAVDELINKIGLLLRHILKVSWEFVSCIAFFYLVLEVRLLHVLSFGADHVGVTQSLRFRVTRDMLHMYFHNSFP